MTAQPYIVGLVLPTALALLPPVMTSPEAMALLVAIGRQESGFRYRRQVAGRSSSGETVFGPARGWWQFEMGGVEAVLEHRDIRDHAARTLDRMGYSDDAREAHLALEHNDVLAAVFARLLLWADPRALPGADDPTQGWLIYLSTWRPGKAKPHTWSSHFDNAWATLPGITRT